MYVEQFEKGMTKGGFSPEFRRQVAEARKLRAEEAGRQMQITLARRFAHRHSMPGWIIDIVLECAVKHEVSPALVLSRSKRREIIACRNEAIYAVKSAKPMLSCVKMGLWFDRDHTSIIHSLAWHQERHGGTVFTTYNLPRARDRAVAWHAERRAQSGDGR